MKILTNCNSNKYLPYNHYTPYDIIILIIGSIEYKYLLIVLSLSLKVLIFMQNEENKQRVCRNETKKRYYYLRVIPMYLLN